MLPSDSLEIVRTSDGTTTARNRDLDVLYRSDEGAAGESLHVFVHGTHLKNKGPVIRVLELGFGTGMNFIRAAHAAIAANATLVYHSVDYAPIHPQFCVDDPIYGAPIQALVQRCRDTKTYQTTSGTGYTLALHPSHWRDADIPNLPFDAIFHDPFDPQTNPDCWTKDTFHWEASHLSDTGRIATYSAAGHIRRAMRDAGLFVARAKGFGRKREMSIAAKRADVLHPLSIKYKP